MTTKNSLQKTIKHLVQKSSNPQLIESAFEFAKEAYKGKNRLSGENYIYHAVRVAAMLEKMNLDATTVAFGILHDLVDDIPGPTRILQIKAIEKKFGKEIAGLLEKISDLAKIRYSLASTIKDNKEFTKEKLENLRRMFLAISGDLRVILVELVSRLDGLNYLNLFSQDKQKVFALETLQIFVPVASRLGLSELRRNMEDISFSYLFPEKYNWLKENIKEEYQEREKYIKNFIPRLKKILKKEHLAFEEINYRAKSYWSTYRKLFRQNMDVSKVHDLVALRIIAKDIPDCYKTLGIIHKYFKPLSDEINDYIAKPKPNGYRSLHTTILADENKIIEIQIRTQEMHKEAEYGICAHWAYKEKIDLSKTGKDFEWLKNAPDFWKAFKLNFFTDRVFAFTPRGDIISLPKGASAVDFAYAIHSEIGSHCESAKIGGKIVQLNHVLENGDIVEILTAKNKKPSKDWLRFVKTSMARSHIKKVVEEEEKSGFKFPIPGFIRKKIEAISEAVEKKKKEKALIRKENPAQISLAGQKGMLITIAKCCNPKPGDKVKAYLSQHRAAVLHSTSCSNFKKLAEKYPEKIIEAAWK